eukprot:10786640-Lingulodinium_polyedra.AAC.1
MSIYTQLPKIVGNVPEIRLGPANEARVARHANRDHRPPPARRTPLHAGNDNAGNHRFMIRMHIEQIHPRAEAEIGNQRKQGLWDGNIVNAR